MDKTIKDKSPFVSYVDLSQLIKNFDFGHINVIKCKGNTIKTLKNTTSKYCVTRYLSSLRNQQLLRRPLSIFIASLAIIASPAIYLHCVTSNYCDTRYLSSLRHQQLLRRSLSIFIASPATIASLAIYLHCVTSNYCVTRYLSSLRHQQLLRHPLSIFIASPATIASPAIYLQCVTRTLATNNQ